MTAHYDPAKYTTARVELIARQIVVRPDSDFRVSVPPGQGIYRLRLKRAFDLFLVCLSAPVSLAVVLLLALVVLLQGGKPFYFQNRVGRGGRIFRLWKLRTMVPDAEARLEAHLAATPAARAEWDHCQKLKEDPRITPFGRFLRKSSLDELPQLWNVLRGDMSLVGPRPAPPREVDIYDPWHRRRLSMKPGLTGLWQVSSRLDEDFDERASLDLHYIDRWSLLLDLKVLVRTVPALLRPTVH